MFLPGEPEYRPRFQTEPCWGTHDDLFFCKILFQLNRDDPFFGFVEHTFRIFAGEDVSDDWTIQIHVGILRYTGFAKLLCDGTATATGVKRKQAFGCRAGTPRSPSRNIENDGSRIDQRVGLVRVRDLYCLTAIIAEIASQRNTVRRN